MIDIDRSLDLDAPEAADLLASLQGNILRGHGRPYVDAMMIRFSAEPAVARRWVKEFATNRATSAASQREGAERKRDGNDGGLFAQIALSYLGYVALGIPADLRPSERAPVLGSRPGFPGGMKSPGRPLRGDPLPDRWEEPYRGEVHALVLLADADLDRLSDSRDAVADSLRGIADLLVVERGKKLTRSGDIGSEGDPPIEHFGFVDGISQPIPIAQYAAKERHERGADYWEPECPLSLALAPDHPGAETFGSFLVFRKLEQNVRAFTWAVEQLADRSGLSGRERERAGAWAVGRYRDGRPLLDGGGNLGSDFANDFLFTADGKGAVCPFAAHIRKTNPRGDLGGLPQNLSLERERALRILRRGVTYGDRPDLVAGSEDPDDLPETGVGLLFMCFASRFENFEIQQEGSDENDFPGPGVGVDAVIGQNTDPVPQVWPAPVDPPVTMANFVTLKGGEYFFAPSLTYLSAMDDV
jgi:Dyp-type peroxidase family